MKFFLGLLIGLMAAVGIAAGAAYIAFGSITDVGERDRSEDVTQVFELDGFNAIDVGGVYELDVRVGDDFSVQLKGAEKELALVEASVENGALVLDRKDGERNSHRWRNIGVTAEITLPALSAVNISGIVDGEISNVAAKGFRVDMSGIGDLDIAGTCEALDANFSGIGEFDGKDLKCKSVDINVSGIGEVNVYASERANASVSGIGAVAIYGSPANVEKRSDLLSKITVK